MIVQCGSRAKTVPASGVRADFGCVGGCNELFNCLQAVISPKKIIFVR